MNWLVARFTEMGDLRAIHLFRRLLGPIVLVHLWPFLSDALDGRTHLDRFHVAFWPWLPQPSEPLYIAILVVCAAAAVAMTLGLAPVAATRIAFVIVTYNVLLDQTSFGHNKAFLMWLLGGMSLVGTSREGLMWPVYLLRVVASSVYLASGISKLLNPHWRNGDVLSDRFDRFRADIESAPFGDRYVELVTSDLFHDLFAPGAIAVELFIGFGLWHPRTRKAAIIVALLFHATIEITAKVEVFSFAAMAALLIWVPRAKHAEDPRRDPTPLQIVTGSVVGSRDR